MDFIMIIGSLKLSLPVGRGSFIPPFSRTTRDLIPFRFNPESFFNLKVINPFPVFIQLDCVGKKVPHNLPKTVIDSSSVSPIE